MWRACPSPPLSATRLRISTSCLYDSPMIFWKSASLTVSVVVIWRAAITRTLVTDTVARCSRCGFTTSLRLMGALSLTAAAVSGLLPAWPDHHVRSPPPFIEPVSLSVHRAPFEPTSLRASRAPDGAHHVPGFEPAEDRFMMSDLTGMPYCHISVGWCIGM